MGLSAPEKAKRQQTFVDLEEDWRELRHIVTSAGHEIDTPEVKDAMIARMRAMSDRVKAFRATMPGLIPGHKATVAHVLTMLGGPMERMESWGPPGRNKRRPCKVRVSLSGRPAKTALLGSVENWHATD